MNLTPLYGPGFDTDPHATYQALRARYESIAPVEITPGVIGYVVLDYDIAREILSDARFTRDPRPWMNTLPPDTSVPPMLAPRDNCLFADGQAHQRLRSAVTSALETVDPTTISTLAARKADELIDSFAAAERADLVSQYALPLAAHVFATAFGAPTGVAARVIESVRTIFDGHADAERANVELVTCFQELIDLKRADLANGARVTDMTLALLAHSAELTDEELVQQLVVVMGTGLECEPAFLANAVRLLLDDRDGHGVIDTVTINDALDQVLWHDPPVVNYCPSYPLHDTEIAGCSLLAHQPVLISIAAANREGADGRDRTGNRAHLGFSSGPHACPAPRIAKVIAIQAIETLLDRLPGLSVDHERVERRPGPFQGALARLPVTFPSPPSRAIDTAVNEPRTGEVTPETPAGGSECPSQPYPSTSPGPTCTRKPPNSGNGARSRGWNSLLRTVIRWWHGR